MAIWLEECETLISINYLFTLGVNYYLGGEVWEFCEENSKLGWSCKKKNGNAKQNLM